MSGIVSIISVILGGGIVWLIAYKHKRNEAKGLADQAIGIGKQETEKAEDLELSNVEKIISIYKAAMVDMQSQYEEQNAVLSDTIVQLKEQLELERTYIRKITELHGLRIKELELEIRELKRGMKIACTTCEYMKSCLKYKDLKLSNVKTTNKKSAKTTEVKLENN